MMMNLALYHTGRRDAFKYFVVFYAPSDTGWNDRGCRAQAADEGFTEPYLGTTDNRT
jgi:hypothetical protein